MNNEPNSNQPKHSNGKPRAHSFHRRKPSRSGTQRDPNAASQKTRSEQRPTPQELKICKVCGKPIFDLAGAVASREDGEPIHFDCAMEILAKEEKLAPDEKIMYIGSGYFGVCAHVSGKLEIRRKIRWEAAGTVQSWRKPMMSSPNLP